MVPYGYTGKMLRVNLSNRTFSYDVIREDVLRKYEGGAGFGARYLYDENPDNIE
jgi:aldehyde:ferredoxin oxidoreductase